MLKKTIKYNDLDDNPQTEDFYFNFSVQELIDMELEVEGGMKMKLEQIVAAENVPAMMGVFKDIILRALGQKSPDGKRFNKSEQMREDFYNSPAYGALFFELIAEPHAAVQFMNALMPKDLMERVQTAQKAQGLPVTQRPAGLDHTPSANLDKHPEHYTLAERLAMPEDEFDRVYGTDAKKWSKDTLVAAMRRRTLSEKEEVK